MGIAGAASGRLLLLWLSIGSVHASTSSNHVGKAFQPPLFTLDDLESGRRSESLRSSLSTVGLLAVPLEDTVVDLQGWCRCRDLAEMEGTETVLLGDQATRRTTLGTATVGSMNPLPLSKGLAISCGSTTAAAMEEVRDQVAAVAEVFVRALDRLVQQEENDVPVLLQTSHGRSYARVQDIVTEASHLEHFHFYSKPLAHPADPPRLALEWHTDAGLFLAFLPAQSCDDDAAPDASFWIQDVDQSHKVVAFPENSIAIMMGAGAEHWLQTRLRLRATSHAVHIHPGTSRAWYGMMHLVPESAIIQSTPEPRTFGEMRKSMLLSNREKSVDDNVAAMGCGVEEPLVQGEAGKSHVVLSPRRRLQHVQNANACNNSTNFFCWMQCLDIPSADQAQGYVNEGYSLYCLDPAILASSGNRVSNAAAPCRVGYVHNANCQGSWQPTAPGVVSADVKVDTDAVIDERFCYGGTSMYMDGFHWLDTACVIYLFPEWVLTTPGALVGASIGTLIAGILLEGVIQQRRQVVKRFRPGYSRLAVSAAFYGIQLTMGYFLMLVVMTYSGPLFLCVVLGLVGGHIFFTAQDAIWKGGKAKKTDKPGETTQHLCQGDCKKECTGYCAALENVEQPVHPEGECNCNSQTDDDDNAGVPEGGTPCCQNTL